LPGIGDHSQQNRHDSVKKLNRLADPRVIKTHLPFSLLPRRTREGGDIPKIIYIMRNPKDVFISYYHYSRAALGWRASKEELAKVFMGGPIFYGPYWKSVLGYWNLRHSPNVLILKYEEMIKDLRAVIRRTCEFLEMEPLTHEQMEKLCRHLSFNSMKDNGAVNRAETLSARKSIAVNPALFMRCGKIGQCRWEMSPQMIAEFDEWIKRSIEGTDLSEKYACSGKDD
ncbi:sulfotransferase family cytosolic 1B member 1-like, partial [Photinus pyralis]|uniref:sulfotransferase family cytosolic 1B member 1-like n=1 Tax=Photinus pyralis TaxID=7054 RepID=UPI0012670168